MATKITRKVTKKSSRKPFGGLQISFKGVKTTVEEVFGSQDLAPSAMMTRLWQFIKKEGLLTR